MPMEGGWGSSTTERSPPSAGSRFRALFRLGLYASHSRFWFGSTCNVPTLNLAKNAKFRMGPPTSARRPRGHVALAKRKANVKTFRLGATIGSEATQPTLSHRAWRSFPGLTMTSGLGQLSRRCAAAEYHRPLSIGLI